MEVERVAGCGHVHHIETQGEKTYEKRKVWQALQRQEKITGGRNGIVRLRGQSGEERSLRMEVPNAHLEAGVRDSHY